MWGEDVCVVVPSDSDRGIIDPRQDVHVHEEKQGIERERERERDR